MLPMRSASFLPSSIDSVLIVTLNADNTSTQSYVVFVIGDMKVFRTSSTSPRHWSSVSAIASTWTVIVQWHKVGMPDVTTSTAALVISYT